MNTITGAAGDMGILASVIEKIKSCLDTFSLGGISIVLDSPIMHFEGGGMSNLVSALRAVYNDKRLPDFPEVSWPFLLCLKDGKPYLSEKSNSFYFNGGIEPMLVSSDRFFFYVLEAGHYHEMCNALLGASEQVRELVAGERSEQS